MHLFYSLFRKTTLFAAVLVLLTITSLPLTLAQTPPTTVFTSCDGRLEFEYPSEWLVGEHIMEGTVVENMVFRAVMMDVVELATNEEAFSFQYLGNDALRISIEFVQRETPQDYDNPYEWLLDVQFRSDTQTFAEPQVVTIQGETAARQDIAFDSPHDVTIDGFRVFVWLPDGFEVTVTAYAFDPTRYAELETVVFALLETVTFTASGENSPPDGWWIYFEDNCRFRLHHPSEWVMLRRNNQLLVFNSLDAQDAYVRRRFDASDELAIKMILPNDVDGFFMGQIDAATATAEEMLMAFAGLEQLTVLSEPETLEIGDYAAVQADIPNGVLIVLTVGEGEFVVLAARTGADGFGDVEADVMALVESIAWRSVDGDGDKDE